MNFIEAVFNQDMVLDQDAFDRAAADFEDLRERIQRLRDEVDQALADLQTGFDTPAGRKFVTSCRNNLIKTLEEQRDVLNHISETIRSSNLEYSTVFHEYEALQTTIRQAVY